VSPKGRALHSGKGSFLKVRVRTVEGGGGKGRESGGIKAGAGAVPFTLIRKSGLSMKGRWKKKSRRVESEGTSEGRHFVIYGRR